MDRVALRRVGPGTAMGGLMREYWMPAAKSSELVAGGAPVRILLLGEQLIGFRDGSGRVGVMDHRCPHRGTSLFFGCNEKDGLRCVYHGWKFDVEGKCLDQPNVPVRDRAPDKAAARAYKAVDRNGLIWVYMGSRAVPPPLPAYGPLKYPGDQLVVALAQTRCNWLQALEGAIDNTHTGFLHKSDIQTRLKKGGDGPETELLRYFLSDPCPEIEAVDTDWGTMYGIRRPGRPGSSYWRVGHFLFPCWSIPSAGPFGKDMQMLGWIPMDDTHTLHISMRWAGNDQGPRAQQSGGVETLPNTTDWLGRWIPVANSSNDYNMDREAQLSGESFTGIQRIPTQDRMANESMGEMCDYDLEHLKSSDLMISRTRRRVFAAAEAHQRDGSVPAGVDDPDVFNGARGGDYLAPERLGFAETYQARMRQLGAEPTEILDSV
jgi:phthalate 4,5-dioxygenase oxygenase subunit